MTAPREPFMAAAKLSLQAACPTRVVLRGMQDPAALGDAALAQGVLSLVADGTDGWVEFTGREGEYGRLSFAIVGHLRVADDATPEALDQAEAALEGELLAWCQQIKPAPLDAVYPRRAFYSKGLERPYGWIVMELEALYV